MNIVIKSLHKKDFQQARKFAIKGMKLNNYVSNQLELYLYSQYFWLLEIQKATSTFAAYDEQENLLGVLLVNMNNEPKYYQSFWANIYVKIAAYIIEKFYGSTAGPYDAINRKMLQKYKQRQKPDGEINFFAVNPEIKGKGIGTKLLKHLEINRKNKLIYLYTNSGSTYQFYLQRGFEKVDEEAVTLKIDDENIDLTCFLFSKRLGLEN